jgi:hypothetical protein
VPLILLAIPSVYAGWAYIEPMVIGTYFGDAIAVAPAHEAMSTLREEWHGVGCIHSARPPVAALLAGDRRHRRGRGIATS